jgi:hypothetical protein
MKFCSTTMVHVPVRALQECLCRTGVFNTVTDFIEFLGSTFERSSEFYDAISSTVYW